MFDLNFRVFKKIFLNGTFDEPLRFASTFTLTFNKNIPAIIFFLFAVFFSPGNLCAQTIKDVFMEGFMPPDFIL